MAAALAVVGICLGLVSAYAGQPDYNEQYRPQLHYSPPSQWMNDPNGMVYLEGEYHLFYQYHPFSTRWGPMHWGHAVSRDLVHWENLPIALAPDSNGMIFSGSVVYDRNNSSGLGTREHPPLVALFTYHDETLKQQGSVEFERQGLAYSLDQGRSWAKYQDNPVLKNPGLRDFRDPKVSWFDAQQKWIMTLAVGDHVAFWSSPDLKHWTHESDFGREWGEHRGVWECPDLIQLAVVGEKTNKYVLIVSVNPGAPNGGSGTQYFVGDFDGHQFVSDAAQWIDGGTDDYAGVTWSNVPDADGRRLFLGWMSNWDYAQQVPTERWRSAMTLPRELRLLRTARGLELHSTPVAELASLRTRTIHLGAQKLRQELELTKRVSQHSGLLELDLELDTRDAGLITLVFSNASGQQTVFRINRPQHRYELDRAASGTVGFSAGFANTQSAPLRGSGERVALQVFVDRASLELFINGGETVMTAVNFPTTPYDRVMLKADREIELKSGAVYELHSIWGGK